MKKLSINPGGVALDPTPENEFMTVTMFHEQMAIRDKAMMGPPLELTPEEDARNVALARKLGVSRCWVDYSPNLHKVLQTDNSDTNKRQLRRPKTTK